MLRKPLHQPEGSEKDGYDTLLITKWLSMKPGNLSRLDDFILMRITKALSALWQYVQMHKVKIRHSCCYGARVIGSPRRYKTDRVSAREESVNFFEKLGYENCGLVTVHKLPIKHFFMKKSIESLDDILHRPDWCAELQKQWHQHIPLSEKMGLRITQYTGTRFIPPFRSGNQNPHHTIFLLAANFPRNINRLGLIWLLMRA